MSFIPGSWLNPFKVITEYHLAHSEAECAHYTNVTKGVNYFTPYRFTLPRDIKDLEVKCGKDFKDCEWIK